MQYWRAKELGKLTSVSVRTLHHYDKIGLLKPTMRQNNGYRLYSEADLLKLQQIIALKFFGFELSQIKQMLAKEVNVIVHFAMQSELLQKKAAALMEASGLLKRIHDENSLKQSIPWEQIIQLIEVYQMTQQLEHAWVKEIFTPEELKQYAAFEEEMKSKSTPAQQAAFEKKWDHLVEQVKTNFFQDPSSEIGVQLGGTVMEWVNEVYGKKYAHLRTKKFEKGFGEGKGLDEAGLTPELVSWLEKAMNAYWEKRIYDVLGKIEQLSHPAMLTLWNEVLDDMYGNDLQRRKAILDECLHDAKVSEAAKAWLRKL